MFASLFAITLGKIINTCCTTVRSSQTLLGKPQLSGPSEALVKDIIDFTCEVQSQLKNESILLKGHREKPLGFYTSMHGEPGIIPFVIKPSHEGDLECVARPQNVSTIEPTVSSTHNLRVVEPVDNAQIIILSDPKKVFEGQSLKLRCHLQAGNHVSYKWLLNDRLISPSPGVNLSNGHLLIERTTSEHSGSYKCEASNKFNKTVFTAVSPEVEITVTDLVSAPDISFTVSKESAHIYSAVVTCQSTKGTPPITFSLYNNENLVATMTSDDRNAIFKVPLVLDQHLGYLKCAANNTNQTVYGHWLPLDVVSVGGRVRIHLDTDVAENFAVIGVRLYCEVERGSHARYQWFLNHTLLHQRGSFYYVVNQRPEQSILLLAVERHSAGTYHCEASNSFDNTTVISSSRLYLDKKVLNHVPVLVAAVIFGCFTLLILLISICCGIALSRLLLQDVTEYNEDDGVMETDSGDELDRNSCGQ
uniref:Si:dkey-93h22.7 n=1 Tax=Echeneis naucrates TaxID=173247 RepID=A0A665UYJ7_ECHNA